MTCCILNQRHCACFTIMNQQNQQVYRIVQHAIHELNHHELDNLIIFNPSRISAFINKCLETHTYRSTQIGFSLYGPLLAEYTSNEDQQPPNNTQVCISAPFEADETQESKRYVACMPHELLFQYKLLALSNNWPLSIITTRTASCWHARQFFKNHSPEIHFELVDSCAHDKELCSTLIEESIGLFIAGTTNEH